MLRSVIFGLIMLGAWSSPFRLRAQPPKAVPNLEFRAPLSILPANLSGSFGELRSNHFHSGLDYRTAQKTGFPVYAVADGYLSRLRIQSGGFGLALYINHPNNQTTVYAHLEKFQPRIAKLAKDRQYQYKSFEIDEFLDAEAIPIKKGEIIGYSGNSGSSGGPHLHFEVRDTPTEATLNPQINGFLVNDNVAPFISGLYVYRLNGKPFNEMSPKQYFQVSGVAGKYQLQQTQTINLFGEVGFGIMANDRHLGLSGLNGVYKIRLEVDEEIVYESELDQFLFEHSRAINAHIDYPTYMASKRSIQKSFISPGNPLTIYKAQKNKGRIDFSDGKKHAVKYTVWDAQGNASVLNFAVQSTEKAKISSPKEPTGEFIAYHQAVTFTNPEIQISFPLGSLYEDLNLQYEVEEGPVPHAYSKMHQIHHPLVPLHLPIAVSIKADPKLEAFKDKAIIVNQNRVSQGGQFENGFVKTTLRSFGKFYIAIDTVAPKITPLNISAGKNMSGISKMTFKITDNLSGIKSYEGYLNGEWVLMEFDAKSSTLWHLFDEKTKNGNNHFELIVRDLKNNTAQYRVDFIK